MFNIGKQIFFWSVLKFVCNLSCAMKPGFGWTDGRTERTIANAASTDIRYWKSGQSWIMTWWWELDLCHMVVTLIIPLPWEKQWQLWLSGSGRSSSEPTPRLGSDPKLRFYDWIWSRLRWVIKTIASLMFCLEKPRAAPGRWRQGREASVKAGSLQGGQSPENNHKHRSPERKPLDKYVLAWSDWWKLVMVR